MVAPASLRLHPDLATLFRESRPLVDAQIAYVVRRALSGNRLPGTTVGARVTDAKAERARAESGLDATEVAVEAPSRVQQLTEIVMACANLGEMLGTQLRMLYPKGARLDTERAKVTSEAAAELNRHINGIDYPAPVGAAVMNALATGINRTDSPATLGHLTDLVAIADMRAGESIGRRFGVLAERLAELNPTMAETLEVAQKIFGGATVEVNAEPVRTSPAPTTTRNSATRVTATASVTR